MLRPALIAILAATLPALVPLAPGPEARPRSAAVASGVTVDVAYLRSLGLGPTADLLQAVVASELAGGVGWAPGSRVVVRLTGLSLNSYAGQSGAGSGGNGGSGGAGGTDFDYLEGDILVLGPRGEILQQRHQVASSPSSSGGAYYLPGAERRRVEAIGRVFASWARRG